MLFMRNHSIINRISFLLIAAWACALPCWVVVSGDRRIQKNRIEREAWRQSRLTIFFLASSWSDLANIDKAWRLIRWWRRIEEQARLVAPPAGFEVPVRYGTGKFKVLKA